MLSTAPKINTKIIQPKAIPKETTIIPNISEILEIIDIPPDIQRNNGLKSDSIFKFLKRNILEHLTFQNTSKSSKRFYHFKDEAKISLETKVQSSVLDFNCSNYDGIEENYLKDSGQIIQEDYSSFYEVNNKIEIKNEENIILDEKIDNDLKSSKESTIIKDKLRNKTQQNNEKTTENETAKEIKIEFEFEKYFVPVEVQDLNEEKDKMAEERDFFKNSIRLFSSEIDKEIDIMEIVPEIFTLKKIISNHYFEGKFYIRRLNNEYYISFSDWLCKKKYFTIKEIIICLFEMNVILTWYYKVESCNIDISKICQIYKENYIIDLIFKNLCDSEETNNFIQKEILSLKFISQQIEIVRKDSAKLEQENKIKSDIMEINEDFEIKENCPKEIIAELKEELDEKSSNNEKENLIKIFLEIIFLNFYSLLQGERFIRSNIRKYIINYFYPFFKYMSEQIISYIRITMNNMKKIISEFNVIYAKIKKILKSLNYKYKITQYGSLTSGLCIEGSDLDLFIYYEGTTDLIFHQVLLYLFENNRKSFKINFKINDIPKKNLITLYFSFQNNIFEDPYKYINNSNNKEINKILKVDISYTSNEEEYNKRKELKKKIYRAGLEDFNFIFCALILKRVFAINDLNKVYTGGLSNYGIQSLIFHIKHRILNNEIKYALIFFVFLERYSKFDFYSYVVEKDDNKKRTKSKFPKTCKDVKYYENMITIVDPINENNLIKGGYTPYSRYSENKKPDNYILEKIQSLLKKQFEVFKKCYVDFSKKEYKADNEIHFILEFFNAKIEKK